MRKGTTVAKATALIPTVAFGIFLWRKWREPGRESVDHKQAEEALSTSEKRFRSLVENTSDIITVMGVDGTVRYESAALERVLGYRPEEQVGSNAFQWIHPDDVERALSIFAEVLSTPGVHTPIEFRVPHADGSWRYLEHIVNNLLDDPDVRGLVVTSRDITERKRSEESLKAYAARLKQHNRELQDFVHVASHDLQEPLRKVRTFSDRLQSKYADALDEQGRDYLKRMEDAAARMQDLIEDLLTLSRVITQGRPFESVNLTEVAKEVVSELQTHIEERTWVEVGELPTIEADQMQMHQLFQNLVDNALKFRKENEAPIVKVHSRLLEDREEDSSRDYADSGVCQVLIEDNGMGFDEKYLERIFAPFQRLHGRGAYEGTGMGLAICRRIVERHGGEITAESSPQQGAKFVVTLPIKHTKAVLEQVLPLEEELALRDSREVYYRTRHAYTSSH